MRRLIAVLLIASLPCLAQQADDQSVHINVKTGSLIDEHDAVRLVEGGIYLNPAAVESITNVIEELSDQNTLLLTRLNETATQLAQERTSPNRWIVAVTVIAAVVASGAIALAVGYGIGKAGN